MGIVSGKSSTLSVESYEKRAAADKKKGETITENTGSMQIIKVDGGIIANLSKNTAEDIPGFSTGTQFSYIPNVPLATIKENKISEVSENSEHCLFVQPGSENGDRGEFVYYVSNENGDGNNIAEKES